MKYRDRLPSAKQKSLLGGEKALVSVRPATLVRSLESKFNVGSLRTNHRLQDDSILYEDELYVFSRFKSLGNIYFVQV